MSVIPSVSEGPHDCSSFSPISVINNCGRFFAALRMTGMRTTQQNKYRLGFIGAGKLAGSVIRGLVRAKFCPPGEIIASEPNEPKRARNCSTKLALL